MHADGKGRKPKTGSTRKRGGKLKPKPMEKSERVVVDEIFGNGTVRLLRSGRSRDHLQSDSLDIETWEEEKEEIWNVEDVEVFVGFPYNRSLQEGDVFFVRDSSQFKKGLMRKYRKKRPVRPLLVDWSESREHTRREIKREFLNLAAYGIAKEEKKKLESLKRQVRRKLDGIIEKT